MSQPIDAAARGDAARSVARPEGAIRATRLEVALDWAASLAPAPLRIATSCCGMSMVHGGDFFEAFGSAPPSVSARSADLLVVAGVLTRRQAPFVIDAYRRLIEPRWVVAWGACAISGGAYDNYATIGGLSRILPVDVVVPGCPPVPEAFREALELLRSGALGDAQRAASAHGASIARGASSEGRGWPIGSVE
jgi:NADH-quinone oxidoreductase subunit B